MIEVTAAATFIDSGISVGDGFIVESDLAISLSRVVWRSCIRGNFDPKAEFRVRIILPVSRIAARGRVTAGGIGMGEFST